VDVGEVDRGVEVGEVSSSSLKAQKKLKIKN
jgi:hypothetical protein